MSNLSSITQASPPVLVHLRRGQPVTDSLAIARAFGRRHDNVLRSIDKLVSNGVISRLEIKEPNRLDERGKKQRVVELTERGALIVMPFVGGKMAQKGQALLVDGFLALRDASQSDNNWLEARHQASASFQAMMRALVAVRLAAGKVTLSHHFTNECRLVSTVAFGRPDVDRESLSPADLRLLEKVESQNSFLIARNFTYKERKFALIEYAETLRSKAAVLQIKGGV